MIRCLPTNAQADDGLGWAPASDADFDRHYAAAYRAPLLQSRAYADAAGPGQRAERHLLYAGGDVVGAVQLLRAELAAGLVQAVILDRGPVFASPALRDRWLGPALQAVHDRFPPRLGRRRRIIPEAAVLPPGPLTRLEGRPGYQTIWLDLHRDEAALHARLRPKWRRDLARADPALDVAQDWVGDDLAALLDRHAAHRQGVGFDAADRTVLLRLARQFLPAGKMLIQRVGPAQAPLALALFFLHGRAATYQVGWVGRDGRAAKAGHLCLWTALLALKARGIRDLDLGGVNDADAAGVKRFKAGLGGELVTLAGQYR